MSSWGWCATIRCGSRCGVVDGGAVSLGSAGGGARLLSGGARRSCRRARSRPERGAAGRLEKQILRHDPALELSVAPAIPTAARASLGHRHLPLHRRRGLDEAAAGAGGGLRGGAGRAPQLSCGGIRPARRRRGRHPGRRLLRRVPTRPGRGRGGRGGAGGARGRADPGADGLCTPASRCSPRRATWASTSIAPRGSRAAATAARCALRLDTAAARRASSSRPRRAPTQGPDASPSGSTSSATATFPPLAVPPPHEPARSARRRSSAASASWPRSSSCSQRTRLLTLTGPAARARPGSRSRRPAELAEQLPGRRLVGAAGRAPRPRSSCCDRPRRSLGVKERASPSTSPTRQLLLVLDNFEQLARGGRRARRRCSSRCPNLGCS